ncbi:hypothetical protein HKBW3S09_02014, partial [Candidatus Hakubella thermalkaliphila]
IEKIVDPEKVKIMDYFIKFTDRLAGNVHNRHFYRLFNCLNNL